MSNLILHPCDIFFTHGESLLSRTIRIFERVPGEEKSRVNHVGIIYSHGSLDIAMAIEALTTVKYHTLIDEYHNKKDKVSIYRPINLSEPQRELIKQKAYSYIGKKYGWLKLVTHLADYMCGKKYVFRRLTNSDNYPICSWVVAHAYKAAGLDFGCPPGMADPDDIWDFCNKNSDKYQCILELTNI